MNPYEYGELTLLQNIISMLLLFIFLLGGAILIWFVVKVILYVFEEMKDN